MATGDYNFTPSNPEHQTNEEDEDDAYRPVMDEAEGSGDSEDEHFGADPAVSTGVTGGMASVGLTTSAPSDAGPDASGSRQKRKRGEGPSKSNKQKIPAAKQIADAVSVIANVSVDRATTLAGNKDCSIPEVMDHLMSLEEVKRDKAFGVRCMQALESKQRREFYVSLKKDPDYLLEWLRFIIQ